jgi:type VI secretion system protein ImpA
MTTALNLTHLGESLSAESACGSDLEYDASFIKLAQLIAPAKPGMIASSDADEDGPDWQEAKTLALELSEKTRDLRLAVRLCRCLTETDGLEGLEAGIGILQALIHNLWDEVHPQLDPEDDMDVTMRLNSLGLLNAPDFILMLDTVPLATTKVGMVATLRDIEISSGKRAAESGDEQTLSSGVVAAAFVEDDPALLLIRKKSVDQAIEALMTLSTSWQSHLDALASARAANDLAFTPGELPQFEEFKRKLANISKYMAERLPEETLDIEEGDDQSGAKIATKTGITNRADAGREIDKIIEWFHRNEPSSPVPIMLARAKSMISMSFIDIVEGLGDSGLTEVRKGAGKASEPG